MGYANAGQSAWSSFPARVETAIMGRVLPAIWWSVEQSFAASSLIQASFNARRDKHLNRC